MRRLTPLPRRLHGPSRSSSARSEVVLDQTEKLTLLEADVVGESLAEVANPLELGLLGELQRRRSDLEVLARQPGGGRLVDRPERAQVGSRTSSSTRKWTWPCSFQKARNSAAALRAVVGASHLLGDASAW